MNFVRFESTCHTVTISIEDIFLLKDNMAGKHWIVKKHTDLMYLVEKREYDKIEKLMDCFLLKTGELL